MIATPSRRRYVLVIVPVFIILYLIVTQGPPLFSPSDKIPSWSQAFRSSKTDTDFPSYKSSGGTPKIRQATMLFEGDKDRLRPMYERSVETHVKHGHKWGTPTHILKRNIVEEGSYFNKPAYLASLMMNEMAKPKPQRADWIVWFDGDSVIMNPSIPWSIFLPPPDFPNVHILATKDNNGFNAGMLILRVHEWTVQTLTEIIALPTSNPNLTLPFYDQSAIEWICSRPGYQESFLYQPRRWWNRYHHDPDGVEAGNMLIHFAGVGTVFAGTATKQEIMGQFLEKVEKKPKDWTRDLLQTTYQEEIRNFWDSLRRARDMLQRSEQWRGDHGSMLARGDEMTEAETSLQLALWKHSDKLEVVEKHTKYLEGLVESSTA